jgi:hypothetical protein
MAITAAELLVRVGADTTGAQRGLDSVSQRLTSFGQSAMAMGGVLSLGVTAPLAMVGGTALRSAADLEQSMNVTREVLGATATQMEEMTQAALQWGADSVFSSTEVGQGMLELAKAGMDYEQVMASMPGVVNLAAAAQTDLATAGKYTAAALNAFGLEASESTRIADLLAATANASSADMVDLAQGLQQGGFAFAAAGQPIEDLAASLAILTSQGLTGSDAGTALKNAFMRLMNPTGEARDMLRELGIVTQDTTAAMSFLAAQGIAASFEDGTVRSLDEMFAAYAGFQDEIKTIGANQIPVLVSFREDKEFQKAYQEFLGGFGQSHLVDETTGQFKETAEIIGILNESLSGLTPVQRNQALATIFMSDGMKAMIPLLNVGAAGYAEMRGAVTEQGAAARVADALMKGLNGAIEDLSGSVESFLSGAAKPFLNTLGEWIRKGAELVDWFGTLPQPVIQAGLAFGLVLAAVGPLALVVGGLSLALGTLLSPLGAVVAAVGLLAAAWASDFGGIQGKTAEVWAAVQPTLASWADWAAARLPAAWGTLREAGTTAATGLAGAWETASEALTGVWGRLTEFLAPAAGRMQQTFGDLAEGMAGIEFGGLAEAAGRLVEALSPLGNLLEVAVMWAGVLGVVMVGAVGLAMNAISGMVGRLPEMVQVAVDGITGVLNGLAGIVEGVTATIKAVIDGDWSAAWTALKDTGLSALEMLGSGLEMGISLIGLMLGGLKDAIATTLGDWGADVTEPLDEMERKVRAFWGWLTGLSWDEAMTLVTDGFSGAVDALLAWAWPALDELVAWEWPEWQWPSLPEWQWPSIPMPSWLGGWFDQASAVSSQIDDWFEASNSQQDGPTWTPGPGGGGLGYDPNQPNITWPAGVAAAGVAAAGMGGVNITIHATVSDQIDLHELALRVAQAIQRRGV